MPTATFITGNPNKAKYLADLIEVPIEQASFEIQEIQSMDLESVALNKAIAAYELLGSPVLVEDQGLYLSALNGFPGPFVKYMVDDGKRLDILINVLNGYDDRSALARTVFVYFDGNEPKYFTGELSGSIGKEQRGTGGYGWDAVFIPDGYGGRTRAELTKAEDHETYMISKPIKAVGDFLRS